MLGKIKNKIKFKELQIIVINIFLASSNHLNFFYWAYMNLIAVRLNISLPSLFDPLTLALYYNSILL